MEEQLNNDPVLTDTTRPEVSFIDPMDDVDLDVLVPSVGTNPAPMEAKPCIVADDDLLGIYKEIVEECREDRDEVSQAIAEIREMVINDGDASSATKEALVAMYKIKTDISDKKTKIADLMTRIVLKEKNTFAPYLVQNNNYGENGANQTKREMIKKISKFQDGKQGKQ